MPQILRGLSLPLPPGGLLDLSWPVLDLVRAGENSGWSSRFSTPCRQGWQEEQASVSR